MIRLGWQSWALRGASAPVPTTIGGLAIAMGGAYFDPATNLTLASPVTIPDADMEDTAPYNDPNTGLPANGCGNWTWTGVVVPSKQSADPHSGSQHIRVMPNSGTRYVRQPSRFVLGQRCNGRCWARGIAGATATLYAPGNKTASTSSATWVQITTAKGTVTEGTLYLETTATGSDFDDVESFCYSVTGEVATAAGGALQTLALAQPTAVRQPYDGETLINSKRTVEYSIAIASGEDYEIGSLSAASYTALHAAAGCTLGVVIRPDATATSERVLLDTCNNSAAAHGIYLAFDAANQKIVFRVANGSGTWHVDAATANASCTRSAVHAVVVEWSDAGGYSIQIDAAAAVTGAVVGVASTGAPGVLTVGATTGGANFYSGVRGPVFVAPGTSAYRDTLVKAPLRTWAGV